MQNMTDNELITLANSRFSNPSLRGDLARMELLRRERPLTAAERREARKASLRRRVLHSVFCAQPRPVDPDAPDFLAILLGD